MSGTAFLPETRISIRWGALTLLILQLIGALAFLVYTAIATQQAGCEVLKSSALATLFALEEDCRGVAGGLETAEGMRRKARVMLVRLRDEAIVLAGEESGRVVDLGVRGSVGTGLSKSKEEL